MGGCFSIKQVELEGCFSNNLNSRDVIVVFYQFEAHTYEQFEEFHKALDEILFYVGGQFSKSEIEEQIQSKNLRHLVIKPDKFAKIKLTLKKEAHHLEMVILSQTQQNSDKYSVPHKWYLTEETRNRLCIWELSSGIVIATELAKANTWRFSSQYNSQDDEYQNSEERNYPGGKKCEGCGGDVMCKKNCWVWKTYAGYCQK